MGYDLSLRPIHYACVSGGKDSLYMLGLILNNLDKYPLDMVVHYELEIDWDWTKSVIDKMETMCKSANIPFVRVRPSVTWEELYNKFDFPTRKVRWCNKHYKLDAAKQLDDFIYSQSCRPVTYIGFCADEEKRFKYNIGDWKTQQFCYPLAEENITEDIILNWARTNPIFSDWYKYFNRQGCMMCPMISRKELAYMYIYYPTKFNLYFDYVGAWEVKYNNLFWGKHWGKNSEQVKQLIIDKWVPTLLSEINQLTLF